MTSRSNAKKAQQDFFSNMQTMFMGEGNNGKGIINLLEKAAEDLSRAAEDMLNTNTSAQPTYGGPNGGPNGGRPTMGGGRYVGDGTQRPGQNQDFGGGYAGYTSSLRTMVGAAAARYGSSGGIGALGHTFRAHYDSDGSIQYYDEIDQHGHKVGEHSRSSTEAQDVFARQQRARIGTSIAGAPSPFNVMGPGGAVHTPGVTTAQHIVNDTIGKIPVVGGVIAGVISGIIGAPDAIANGIVNERAKNAQYQAILGGTNWSTGVHNRWLETGFKLSQLYSGGLTGNMSEEAFRGVTSLGYTGDSRFSALGLITSNYKNLGMSPEDSLKLVGIMAQSSNTAFEQLKTTLNEVGDAAKNTGQNLELARANLTNLFAITTQNLGGPGSLQASGMVGTYQTSLGRDFANVNFSSLVPGNNLGLTALQASSVGMTLSDYELAIAGGGPKAQQLQLRATNAQTAQALAPSLAAAGPTLNRLIQKAGGLKAITASNDSLNAFVQRSIGALQGSGLNVNALQSSISAIVGTPMSVQQAVEYMIKSYLGVTPDAAQKQQKTSMLQHSLHPWQHANTPGHAGWYTAQTIDPASGDTQHFSWPTNQPHQIITNPDGSQSLLLKNTRGTTPVDPIIDRFKDKFYNESTHLVVQTAQGPKVVSGTYAFDHLKDQIARGSIKFVGGPNDGQSVASVVGGGYAESNYKGTNTTHVQGTDTGHFHSVAAWEKANPNKNNGSGGKVLIEPNPALMRLLNITASGNATVAWEGAQSGYAPNPAQYGYNLGPN